MRISMGSSGEIWAQAIKKQKKNLSIISPQISLNSPPPKKKHREFHMTNKKQNQI